MKSAPSHFLSAISGAGVLAFAVVLSGMQGSLSKEKVLCLTPEQQEILGHMSIVYLDDGSGSAVNKTIRIDAVNVQVVNGTHTTDGTPNGVGNLIVGYDELGHPQGDDRTGSHFVVVGARNSYASFGGVVAGTENTVTGAFAAVVGGRGNAATGRSAAVSGGEYNSAPGEVSAVSGGISGFAGGYAASVGGGEAGAATGYAAAVNGGLSNLASGDHSTVCGGGDWKIGFNHAAGNNSWIGGGFDNRAVGSWSVVSGGSGNQALHTDSTVGGGCAQSTSAACDHVHGADL